MTEGIDSCVVRIETMNGKSISIGMGDMTHYCFPRMNWNDFEGCYESVEVGYPQGFENLSGVEKENGYPIYPYVKVEIIVSFIRSNGGLKSIKNRYPETNFMIPQMILDCWDYEGLMRNL